MITINNQNYCEYCFQRLAGQYCPICIPKQNPVGTLAVGEVLAGRYIVGKILGKGGFGRTYLCLDTATNTRVAIKEYFPETLAHRDAGQKIVRPKQDPALYKKGEKKFYKEASLLARLKDIPGVVKVESFFMENNTAYFVMEYLVGNDLRNYFQKDPHPNENLIIYIGIEVLKSLRSLHQKSVLHRDIAPDNIFMCENGIPKLIDFGASRVTIGTISNSLSVILKPGFAPFEQYQTKGKQGPWTDIYALGATMYYLLKKRMPPDAVSRFNSDTIDFSGISPYLGRILAKMMAIRVEDRYKSADEVLPELMRAQSGNTPQPNPQNLTPNPDNIQINNPDVQKHSSIRQIPIEPINNKTNPKIGIIVLCVVIFIIYILFLSLLLQYIG